MVGPVKNAWASSKLLGAAQGPFSDFVLKGVQGLHSAAQVLHSAAQGPFSDFVLKGVQGLHSAAQALHSAAWGPFSENTKNVL